MKINDIVNMMKNKDAFLNRAKDPILPNGSLPPKGYVNPYATPGMDITGMKPSDFKMMPVDKQTEQTIKAMALAEVKRGYGMSDPDDDSINNFIKAYYMSDSVAIDDRKHYAHTLGKMFQQEFSRIFDFIESRVPGWEPGKEFDLSIFDDYQSGIDINV